VVVILLTVIFNSQLSGFELANESAMSNCDSRYLFRDEA